MYINDIPVDVSNVTRKFTNDISDVSSNGKTGYSPFCIVK